MPTHSNRLQQILDVRGLTHEQFGVRARLSRKTIDSAASGRGVSRGTEHLIAAALGLRPEAVFPRDEQSPLRVTTDLELAELLRSFDRETLDRFATAASKVAKDERTHPDQARLASALCGAARQYAHGGKDPLDSLDELLPLAGGAYASDEAPS